MVSRLPKISLALLVAVLLTGAFAPQSAMAQVLYGSLTGVVSDPSGASIPGAELEATQTLTGRVLKGTSDAEGRYSFVNAPAGPYDVKVTADGFRSLSQQGVTVSVNSVTRLDVTLELGQVTEVVTVEASAATLQTEKADTSSEISSNVVKALPLPGFRNYQSLVNLVPGATPAAFQNSILDTPSRSLTTNINGTNRNNNVTRIDGAASINVWLPHHAGYVAPADTVETVQITTGSGDAEQGLTGGASTTVVTKSGTNELHGSAFWFHDNQHLRARNFFSPTKPVSNYNNFGGTIGGPIKKNKLFYFFGYDKTTQRVAGVRTSDEVPTVDQRAGDFSAYSSVIYDPMTGNADGTGRTPFANNAIPLARQSSIARNVQTYYPLPNATGTQNNYLSAGAPPFARQQIDPKINWNVTEKWQLWGKYANMSAPVSGNAIFGVAGGPAPGGDPGNGDTKVNLFTIGNTYTISPNLLYDGVVGFWRQKQSVTPQGYGTDIDLGIPGVGGPDVRQQGFPNINPGYTGFGAPGWQPMFRDERNWTMSQNFTWIKSAHQFRMGFDMIYLSLDHWQPELGGGPRGVINFNGEVTALKGGAAPSNFNQYAAFLLGEASSMQKAIQNIQTTGKEKQFAFYLTDRWKATNKLTVNFGLRYENYPLMQRFDGVGLEVYDPATNTMTVGGLGGVPRNNGLSVSNKLFSPRLGLAYRLDDKTVIRTGYGLNFDPMPWSRPLRGQYPFVVTFDFQPTTTFIPFRTLDQGIPEVVGPDLNNQPITVPTTATLRTPYPNSKINRGYIQSWNFTIERKLPANIITSIGYVGTASIGMFGDRDINAADIGGGSAGRPYASAYGRRIGTTMWDSYLNANYHSLQVAINRSFSKGLSLKGAYTYSKAINMTDDDGWASVSWNSDSVFNRNRARAGYDRRQMFQMGFVYELPVGQNMTGAGKAILGGWQVSGIMALLTGTPFTVGASGASLNAPGNTQTADQVGTVNRLGNVGTTGTWYNTDAFAPVTRAGYGTTGRNILDRPGIRSLDLTLSKDIPVTEKVKAQFRVEAYNFTNTPQFGTPDSNVNNSGFMTVTSTSGSLNQDRQFRLGLRFSF
ncbi:MAG: TonB-dependent receptor [Acidobacteria bacterium]|nr:TonB-dependent receptor [Acidobacteriota bacterium]